MVENYGFEASMLRFVQIHQIRAENRPKSEAKIWNEPKNVVPLHCLREDDVRRPQQACKQGDRRIESPGFKAEELQRAAMPKTPTQNPHEDNERTTNNIYQPTQKLNTTMARTNIPMIINLRQNKNDESTAYGKYFAECDSKEPLNLKGFAKHMTSHGKIADYQMCVLVLGQVVDCMTELLSQGQPVKLDGLGTFYPSVDGQKQGKAVLAEAVAGGPDAMINGIKINFNPENSKGEQLTSRAFKDQCIFEWGYLVESVKRTVGGKEKRFQNKTPLSYVLAPAADQQGNG